MVNSMNKFNKIIIITLVLMFAMASFFAPQWLNSIVFMIVYLVFALLLLISVFLIPDLFLKILHTLLAILIISFVLVKASNERVIYTFAKGAEYQVVADEDTLSMELVDFTILKGEDKQVPDNYLSEMLVNGQKVQISVNHPFAYKRSRFYQNAFGASKVFMFCSHGDTLKLFPGQSAEFMDGKIDFHEYDELMRRIALSFNDTLHLIPLEDESALFYVLPGESIEATIVEYVEVKGHIFMFIIATLGIIMMVFVRFRSL